MIAVFVKNLKLFKAMDCHPERNFVRIRDTRDLSGVEWTGVMEIDYFTENKYIAKAYKKLRTNRPDLFV